MSIVNKKIKIFQIPVVKKIITRVKSEEKQSVTQEEDNIKIAELLLKQINSGEEEVLFI